MDVACHLNSMARAGGFDLPKKYHAGGLGACILQGRYEEVGGFCASWKITCKRTKHVVLGRTRKYFSRMHKEAELRAMQNVVFGAAQKLGFGAARNLVLVQHKMCFLVPHEPWVWVQHKMWFSVRHKNLVLLRHETWFWCNTKIVFVRLIFGRSALLGAPQFCFPLGTLDKTQIAISFFGATHFLFL